ncbi:HNH endonuclease [Siphonobacter sp. BAB-5405]|uniref:HNH endonuclease n=1 Tax=Siphonobacter sp. BAB-5405 TaxID=1864825 RepID=UPI001304D97B|nr:HNH endonuclease [Siphonobacter sp. BAB-5405]
MSNICIFCDNENEAKSVEHIVPESLGNTKYIMPRNSVCDNCNKRFSKFEEKVLTKTVFAFERARFAIKTKKGNASIGKLNKLEFSGDKNFRKNIVSIRGISLDDFKEFDPNTGSGQLVIPGFVGSENATSKFLLKVALESLYKSQKSTFKSHNFNQLKEFLNTKSNIDWPFITTSIIMPEFKSIPRFEDKHHLNEIKCSISFCKLDDKNLLFKFKYGGVTAIINMLDRNLDWIKKYRTLDETLTVLPEHYRKKLSDSTENKE